MSTISVEGIIIYIIILVFYFIYPYFRAKTSEMYYTYLETYLLTWFLSFFGVIYIEYSIKKNKKTKKDNTLTILSMIKEGKCPRNGLVEKSYFNDSHNLWNDYQDLRKKMLKNERAKEARYRKAEEKRLVAIEESKRLQKEKDIKKYGKTAYEDAEHGLVKKGMDTYLLKIARRGNPDYIDERLSNNKYKYKYFYEKFTNQRGNDDYKFQVDIEDDKVVGFKDLNFN